MPTDTAAERDVVLLDTSAAIALIVEDHEAHSVTLNAVGGRRLGLSGHAWFETYSVLTRLPGGSADRRPTPFACWSTTSPRAPSSVKPSPETLAERSPDSASRVVRSTTPSSAPRPDSTDDGSSPETDEQGRSTRRSASKSRGSGRRTPGRQWSAPDAIRSSSGRSIGIRVLMAFARLGSCSGAPLQPRHRRASLDRARNRRPACHRHERRLGSTATPTSAARIAAGGT